MKSRLLKACTGDPGATKITQVLCPSRDKMLVRMIVPKLEASQPCTPPPARPPSAATLAAALDAQQPSNHQPHLAGSRQALCTTYSCDLHSMPSLHWPTGPARLCTPRRRNSRTRCSRSESRGGAIFVELSSCGLGCWPSSIRGLYCEVQMVRHTKGTW